MYQSNVTSPRFLAWISANAVLGSKRALIVVAVGLTANILWAADDEKARPRQVGGDFQKRLLEEFDADNNGRLDEAERAKAKASMSKRRPGGGNPGLDRREILKRFDKDGDGRLNEDERQAAMKARNGGVPGARPDGPKPLGGRPMGDQPDRREIMKRFDKNGDGKIDETERAAIREAFAKRRGDAAGKKRPEGARPDKSATNKSRPARPGADAARRGGGEFLKRFDKNGDGKLDESERAAARAAMSDRRGGGAATPAGEKPDKGRVDKKALLKEFDANGDGKLTDDERAAARKAFEERKADKAKE